MSGSRFNLRAAGAVAGLLVALDAHAQVALQEQPDHVTQGTVIVDAPPAEVYKFVTDYERWPVILRDVSSVKVERGDPDHARVRFRSRAFESEVTVQFTNEPGVAIRFVGVKGPPGSRASGEYLLQPIDGGKRTRVIARLRLYVVGLSKLFASESRLRGYRQAKLNADLGDAQRWFATHR